MSSLAVGRGLDGLELWLGDLFTAAELAAADLLLQLSLSVAGGSEDDEATSSATTSSHSPRWVSPCSEGFTVDDKEERVVEEPAVSAGLDTRARKRYRLLSELYSATSPTKRRKTCDGDHDGDSESSEEAGDEVGTVPVFYTAY